MKAFKKRLKPIAFLLTALLLLQSCVVYHKAPTTLERASRQRTRTKINDRDGTTHKYAYITYEEGVYYGVNKDLDERGRLVKSPLSESEIKTILTKNKSASAWVTAGAIAIPVITILIIAVGTSMSYSPW